MTLRLLIALLAVITVLSARAELPPIETGEEQLARQSGLFVREIILDDNSLFTRPELQQLFAPYLNRRVSIEDLHRLRVRLSATYFERGRVNSGVIIPDQNVRGGIVHFQEIAGLIDTVELSGVDHLDEYFARESLGRGLTGGSLDINRLQESMQVLQQHPLVERINAQVVPGTKRGKDTLRVEITETSPYRFGLSANNYRAPTVGGEQIVASFTHLSLTGRGDVLALSYSATDGVDGSSAAYTFTFRSGKALRVYWSDSDSTVIEAPFDDLGISSVAKTAGVELDFPLVREVNRKAGASLAMESKRSESFLFGQPFSFTEGDVFGKSAETVLVAGANYSRSRARDVLAAEISVRKDVAYEENSVAQLALDALLGDPAKIEGAEDKDFISFRGQISYTRLTGFRDSRIALRGRFQLTTDSLLAVEKMPIGGSQSARGYRENRLVRDNGIAATVQWTFPFFRDNNRALNVGIFADYATAWDSDDRLASSEKSTLRSVGLNISWQPMSAFTIDLTVADALNEEFSGGDDLQDDGIHFSMSYQF